MKPIRSAVLLVLFVLLVASAPARASGVGGYLDLFGGASDWTFEVGPFDVDDSATMMGVGAGFLFDTNLAKNSLVNYRLTFGPEVTNLNFDDEDSVDLFGLALDNTVGFGVLRSKEMRLWVGPDVKIAYHWGDGDGITDSMRFMELGMGPTVGLNLHNGRTWDLCLSLGARWSFFAGDTRSGDVDITGDGASVVFRIAFAHRSLDDTVVVP